MCGIVGYTGKKQGVPILLQGLEKLEYRGYDSAGICMHDGKTLQVAKTKGRLRNLKQLLEDRPDCHGHVGIGHTRWATHGEPSDRNSHPHLSCSGKIAVVHNGIIENEQRLRTWLEGKKIHFLSETDTEVAANLVGYYYDKCGNLLQAVRAAAERLEGSFALGILCRDLPDTLVAVKKDSPLVFGFGEEESFVASDVTALLKYTRKMAYLEDGEMAVATAGEVRFYDALGEPAEKQPMEITWQPEDAQRGGYAHFMLKEIFEQPKAVLDTVRPRITEDGSIRELWEKPPGKIYLVACGSAYYVALLAKYTFEKSCRVSAEAMAASEFRYSDPVAGPEDLVILISQSGETADTLAALKLAKERGCKTLAIVNVAGSAMSKLADRVLYTWAGPEIAVATTKALSAQLAVIWLMTAAMENRQESDALPAHILTLPERMQKALNPETVQKCQYYADRFCGAHNVFYIGRNTDYGVCLEGSLKLKEVAYLHSEAYPAGELKHGPIAMIQKGTLVIALVTVEQLADKMAANIREVMARGAEVLCVVREGLEERFSGITNHVITVPGVHPVVQPSLSVLPLQLFAYFVAVNRGCEVDKPRNLAKSVTVE